MDGIGAAYAEGRERLTALVDGLTEHEHDVRGALGRPGARDSKGIEIGLEFLIAVGLDAGGLPPLEVRAGDRTWTVGTGGPAVPGDPEEAVGEATQAALIGAEPPTERAAPAGTIEAEPFELFRALTGRRSLDQIRELGWRVDPEPYLAAFRWGPFTVSPVDVVEAAAA